MKEFIKLILSIGFLPVGKESQQFKYVYRLPESFTDRMSNTIYIRPDHSSVNEFSFHIPSYKNSWIYASTKEDQELAIEIVRNLFLPLIRENKLNQVL